MTSSWHPVIGRRSDVRRSTEVDIPLQPRNVAVDRKRYTETGYSNTIVFVLVIKCGGSILSVIQRLGLSCWVSMFKHSNRH